MNDETAVIYMGGTFGCAGHPLSPIAPSLFKDKLQQYAELKDSFHFFYPQEVKDSSECTLSDWLALALQIQTLSRRFQKFIIIHGTDTLSYAAAVLHHIFAQRLSIVITGSQLPLLEPDAVQLRAHSDALANFNLALGHINQQHMGVAIAFGEQIHPPRCYKLHTQHPHAFISATDDHPDALDFLPFLRTEHIQQAQHIDLRFYPFVPIAPEQTKRHIKALLDQPPHILILQGYGSGNIPFDTDLQHYLQQLITQGCWVIISSQVLFGALSQQYATGSWLNELGVVFDPHYSQSDCYARAMLLYLVHGQQTDWQSYWTQGVH